MPFQPTYDVPAERRPFFLPAVAGHRLDGRHDIGCLFLHGFMGSPGSARPLADFLAERGVASHAPLLPGHGHWPDKLYRVPRKAWLAEAEESLETILQRCSEVVIVGHSMGAVLGAHAILRNRSAPVRGIVMLSPVYEIPDGRLKLMRYLRYVMPWFYPHKSRSMQKLMRERVRDFYPDFDFDDPENIARLPMLTRVPTGAFDEMVQMVKLGCNQLFPHLQLPVLIFQGKHDPAIINDTHRKVYELIPSQDKQIEVFPDAGHELMRPADPIHTTVWQMIATFIEQKRSH